MLDDPAAPLANADFLPAALLLKYGEGVLVRFVRAVAADSKAGTLIPQAPAAN